MTERGFDAAVVRAWLAAVADAVALRRDELTDLDAAIGDGDHGANLNRGFAAVKAAITEQAEKAEQSDASAGRVLITAGSTLISKVGGASGPLYGSALRAIGKSLEAASDSAGGADPDAAAVLAALRAGLDAITRLGGAGPGDKTMVDAYGPAIEAFEGAIAVDAGLPAAALAAAGAAELGATATIPLVARKGRASYLGERSADHQDPGATSTALLFRALADVTDPANSLV